MIELLRLIKSAGKSHRSAVIGIRCILLVQAHRSLGLVPGSEGVLDEGNPGCKACDFWVWINLLSLTVAIILLLYHGSAY